MQASIVIGNQDKTRPADARHTLLRFLTDHLYKSAGNEMLIPWHRDRGKNKSHHNDSNYGFVYHSIRSETCVLDAQLDRFHFDSWQVLHNDGDNENHSFYVINLYRGKTEYNTFCKKKNRVIKDIGVYLCKDWMSFFTDRKSFFDKRLGEEEWQRDPDFRQLLDAGRDAARQYNEVLNKS